MQELVRRKIKEVITAPKISSSGKVEHYVIPSYIEQLRGLPKSSGIARNGVYIPFQSGCGIA
jgi:hypothetical protein